MRTNAVVLALILGGLGVSVFASTRSAPESKRVSTEQHSAPLASREVAKAWFQCLEQNRFQDALGLLDKDILWVNIPVVPGITDVIPWIGTFHGADEALRGISIWSRYARLRSYQLRQLAVDGETAIGLVREQGECLSNGKVYEVDVAVVLTIVNGRIINYRTLWDPSPLLRAFGGSW